MGWQHISLGFCLLLHGDSAAVTHCTSLLVREASGSDYRLLGLSLHPSPLQSTQPSSSQSSISSRKKKRIWSKFHTLLCLMGRHTQANVPAIPTGASDTLVRGKKKNQLSSWEPILNLEGELKVPLNMHPWLQQELSNLQRYIQLFCSLEILRWNGSCFVLLSYWSTNTIISNYRTASRIHLLQSFA